VRPAPHVLCGVPASGRDAAKARKRNPAEELKTAKKRADSHQRRRDAVATSGARCVGH